MNVALPKEMQSHTYRIMYRLEGTHWWFVGRRRILSMFIEQALAGTQYAQKAHTPRILDVGCGTGANIEMLRQYGEVNGVDISEEALAFCRARGIDKVKLGAAEELPYEDQSFDLVTALDVVEHLDNDTAGLKEMRRVLKPGGRLVIFVPAFMFLWGVQDDISNHRRRYTLQQLCKVVSGAGFKINRATYINITFFAPILLGRLLMRATGLRPESENNINISILNNLFGKILGAESFWLKRRNFPFGVSALCIAQT
jgi:SAM-dependent methyltransferase